VKKLKRKNVGRRMKRGELWVWEMAEREEHVGDC